MTLIKRFLILLCLGLFSVPLFAAENNRLEQYIRDLERDNLLAGIENNPNLKEQISKTIRDLILERFDPNSHGQYFSALHIAVRMHDVYLVELLHQYGADFNLDVNGITPLSLAESDMVSVLVRNGAHPNLANSAGSTPLELAAGNGDAHLIETLVSHGAQVNLQGTTRHNNSPLILAVESGDAQTVLCLIMLGANIHYINTDRLTALDYAAFSGYTRVIVTLIIFGYDQGYLAGIAQAGQSAVHVRQANAVKLLRYFLDFARDETRSNTLQNRLNLFMGFAESLGEKGAYLYGWLRWVEDHFINCGDNTFHTAVRLGSLESLASGQIASINSPNIFGQTPLWLALVYNVPSVLIEMLISNGANPFFETAPHSSLLLTSIREAEERPRPQDNGEITERPLKKVKQNPSLYQRLLRITRSALHYRIWLLQNYLVANEREGNIYYTPSEIYVIIGSLILHINGYLPYHGGAK